MSLSRQRQWQIRHYEAGLCIRCSQPRNPKAKMCDRHLELEALGKRAKLGTLTDPPRTNIGRKRKYHLTLPETPATDKHLT